MPTSAQLSRKSLISLVYFHCTTQLEYLLGLNTVLTDVANVPWLYQHIEVYAGIAGTLVIILLDELHGLNLGSTQLRLVTNLDRLVYVLVALSGSQHLAFDLVVLEGFWTFELLIEPVVGDVCGFSCFWACENRRRP